MIDISNINPYLINISFIKIKWFSALFLIEFILVYIFFNIQRKKAHILITGEKSLVLFMYLLVGVIIGARVGYIFIYNFIYYYETPGELFAIWHGGMSFYGGLAGGIISGALFCRKYSTSFWILADLIAFPMPLAIGIGRVGNFINGELYGLPTELPFGVIFPGTSQSRHPVQLYESFFEGAILFTILLVLKGRVRIKGHLFCIFIMLYSFLRFIVEFLREPDVHLGYIWGFFTMGQILCTITFILGFMTYYSRSKNIMK